MLPSLGEEGMVVRGEDMQTGQGMSVNSHVGRGVGVLQGVDGDGLIVFEAKGGGLEMMEQRSQSLDEGG